MMEQITRGKGPQGDARMSASKRFGRYKKEGSKSARDIDVTYDSVMAGALEAWQRYDKAASTRNECIAINLAELFKSIDFSPEEIRRFCVLVKGFEEGSDFSRKLGLFLTEMINASSHDRFEVPLKDLKGRPTYLCAHNRKHVIIRGDVGGYLGDEMRGGSILLLGNADNAVGTDMRGGNITVNGNAGGMLGYRMSGGLITVNGPVGFRTLESYRIISNYDRYVLGNEMSGGRIVVNGDAIGDIGEGMCGGEIHLNGDFHGKGDPKIQRGRVFHRGKLIYGK
jgi:formylmethanofuran dehydrogenase subunit C